MKNPCLYTLLSILVSLSASTQAKDLNQLYPKGKGSRFALKIQSVRADAMVYISDSSKTSVGVETYLTTAEGTLPVEMWLQTRFDAQGDKQVDIRDMFVWMKGNPKPEVVPLNQLGGDAGLNLGDFILRDEAELKRMFVGNETVKVPAGTIRAQHYRKAGQNNEAVDFWISDEAKPLGIVKIEGSGRNQFTMSLAALIQGVKSKINPSQAVPITAATQTLLKITGVRSLIP